MRRDPAVLITHIQAASLASPHGTVTAGPAGACALSEYHTLVSPKSFGGDLYRYESGRRVQIVDRRRGADGPRKLPVAVLVAILRFLPHVECFVAVHASMFADVLLSPTVRFSVQPFCLAALAMMHPSTTLHLECATLLLHSCPSIRRRFVSADVVQRAVSSMVIEELETQPPSLRHRHYSGAFAALRHDDANRVLLAISTHSPLDVVKRFTLHSRRCYALGSLRIHRGGIPRVVAFSFNWEVAMRAFAQLRTGGSTRMWEMAMSTIDKAEAVYCVLYFMSVRGTQTRMASVYGLHEAFVRVVAGVSFKAPMFENRTTGAKSIALSAEQRGRVRALVYGLIGLPCYMLHAPCAATVAFVRSVCVYAGIKVSLPFVLNAQRRQVGGGNRPTESIAPVIEGDVDEWLYVDVLSADDLQPDIAFLASPFRNVAASECTVAHVADLHYRRPLRLLCIERLISYARYHDADDLVAHLLAKRSEARLAAADGIEPL